MQINISTTTKTIELLEEINLIELLELLDILDIDNEWKISTPAGWTFIPPWWNTINLNPFENNVTITTTN